MVTKHITVLKKELIDLAVFDQGKTFVDATLGGGGHLIEAIAQVSNIKDKSFTFVAIDADLKAIELFIKRKEVKSTTKISETTYEWIQSPNIKIYIVHSNFDKLSIILDELKIEKVSSIWADLGTSQDQLVDQARGFSYKNEQSALDMRMDSSLQVTAADLLNGLTKKELVELFTRLADLDSYHAAKLANSIVAKRKNKPILTIKELKTLIYQTIGSSKVSRTLNNPGQPLMARVFQALRIAVNHELYSLQNFLPQAFEALDAKGRLSVISFHSGEDRIVKRFFKTKVDQKQADYLEKLLVPDSSHVESNPRSRSAKLRSIRKI